MRVFVSAADGGHNMEKTSKEHKQFRAILAQFVESIALWRRAEVEGDAVINSWTNIAHRLPLIDAARADPRVRNRTGWTTARVSLSRC